MLMFVEILIRDNPKPLHGEFKDPSLYRSWVVANIGFHGYFVMYKRF